MTGEEIRLIADYFRHKFLRVLHLDRIIARSAAEIVRDYEIKPPDAIHIASALRARCANFLTYDGDTSPVSGLLSLNGKIPDLEIKRPSDFTSGDLFG